MLIHVRQSQSASMRQPGKVGRGETTIHETCPQVIWMGMLGWVWTPQKGRFSTERCRTECDHSKCAQQTSFQPFRFWHLHSLSTLLCRAVQRHVVRRASTFLRKNQTEQSPSDIVMQLPQSTPPGSMPKRPYTSSKRASSVVLEKVGQAPLAASKVVHSPWQVQHEEVY